MPKWIPPVFCGVGATLVMDVANNVASKLGLVKEIDLLFIGRLMSSWTHGHFVFDSPALVPAISDALYAGRFYHYAIGVLFALAFWQLSRATLIQRIGLINAGFVFGLLSSLVSLCLVFPSCGMGMLGLKFGYMPLISSLFNHAAYGLGLGLAFYLQAGREPDSTVATDLTPSGVSRP